MLLRIPQSQNPMGGVASILRGPSLRPAHPAMASDLRTAMRFGPAHRGLVPKAPIDCAYFSLQRGWSRSWCGGSRQRCSSAPATSPGGRPARDVPRSPRMSFLVARSGRSALARFDARSGVGAGRHEQSCGPPTPPPGSEVREAQPKCVGYDGDRGEAHRRGGQYGAQQDAEEGVEDARGGGYAQGVVSKGED